MFRPWWITSVHCIRMRVCACVCVCMRFLSHGTLIITAVPDVTKHMKHTSWIMESYFYISPHFTPILPPSSPSIPQFLWCFHWCLISSALPPSEMVHLALCSIVGLSGRDGFMGKNAASPQHYIELYLHERLLHTIGFNAYPLLSSKTPRAPPPPPPLLHVVPSPSVYCWKSHRANWDRAVKWSRRDVVPLRWKLDSAQSVCSASSLFLSAYPQPPPQPARHLCPPSHPTLSNTFSNTMSRVACNTSVQQGTGKGGHDWKMR